MLVGVVSDIHCNLTAFDAVLADIQRRAPDLVLHGGGDGDGDSLVFRLRLFHNHEATITMTRKRLKARSPGPPRQWGEPVCGA